MDNKNVILIVGASSGIGYECAKLFLEKQNKVYNFSRTECKLEGVINFLGDVVETSVLKNCVEKIIYENKRIDKLIYSAGFSMASPLESVESCDYQYLFNVNLFAVMEAIKATIPIMKENKFGRIIVVSSIGGVTPIPFDSFYSASKSALNMFAQAINLEFNKFNIHVTSLMPGGTKTNFSFKRKIYQGEKLKDYENNFYNATKKLHKIEQKGMNAKSVAKCIVKTSNKKIPPIIASSGLCNKITHTFSKFIPKKCLNRIVVRKFFK